MYINEPLSKYLDDAASGKSTPGGGSVAALAGALGAALNSMVCNFTVGKKKYKDVEAEVSEILSKSEEMRAKLTEFVQADTEAYSKVSSAYKMPKKTKEQKKERTKTIQKALKGALEVPLEAVKCCHEVLKLNQPLVEKGNPNLISDVGVSVSLAWAAMESAALNVEINIAWIKDEDFCDEVRQTMDPLISEGMDIKNEVWDKVVRKIRK